VDDRLGVGVASVDVAATLELRAQRGVVVDLAVVVIQTVPSSLVIG